MSLANSILLRLAVMAPFGFLALQGCLQPFPSSVHVPSRPSFGGYEDASCEGDDFELVVASESELRRMVEGPWWRCDEDAKYVCPAPYVGLDLDPDGTWSCLIERDGAVLKDETGESGGTWSLYDVGNGPGSVQLDLERSGTIITLASLYRGSAVTKLFLEVAIPFDLVPEHLARSERR